MSELKIYVHGSYVGTTGYNQHTRDFFRELSNHTKLKIRNFTIGKSWTNYSDNCHDNESYINDIDKKILYEQVLWTGKDTRENFKIYKSSEKEFIPDFNLILCETNHFLFYENYIGPKIAFNVWESTRQPKDFFNKLKEFDELWVPSEWQKKCSIEQGYDPNKIQVVPEGVDIHTFFPENVEKLNDYNDGRFKFLLFGRWDYRKSTKEIIETFLKTFSSEEPIDLVVSIDNPWGEHLDGYKTTEERLKSYNLLDERIKIIHFPSREDYIKYLKTGHVFVSCARSEGWNLPLIEAMACGTPSIYSDCCAQLEFAQNKGFPVKIIGEKPANTNSYARFTMSDLPGNYYEPDFDDLSKVMRYVYSNYEECKTQSIKDSEIIRRDFSWENVGRIGYEKSLQFYNKINTEEFKLTSPKNIFNISYLDGPKLEINGNRYEQYKVEFINSQSEEVLHSATITNNMWTSCSKKYYIPWKIKVNEQVIDEFNLENKNVLISMESKSLGDTIAWAPYVVEFQKRHKCNVIFSTFHNKFFENFGEYKNIKFVNPGSSVDCYVVYRLGWFKKDGKWNDTDKNPNQVNLIPLQKTASDILGLEYQELNYGVNLPKMERPIEEKYVVFAPNATAGCKEWVYDNWVILSKMLNDIGYKVVITTINPYIIENTINIWNEPLEIVANYLHHASAFIGLGSGLSWLNWGLGKHTHMINGFSKNGHEFSSNITRIFTPNVCVNCWNDEVFVFDAGDWDWCPIYKNTTKQHICQKSITPLQVFNTLNL